MRSCGKWVLGLLGLVVAGWLVLRPGGLLDRGRAGRLGDELVVDLGGGVTMQFVLIQPGSFMMGSDRSEETFLRPVHQVTITRPFYMGKYEVTQEQWEKISGQNRSLFRDPRVALGGRRPVENVRWYDCVRFAEALNGKAEGYEFRLPTEAEWEYASRAGSTGVYGFGDDVAALDEFAWHGGNARGETHPVGQKKPNAWGLFDMHGNVWEWCQDFYGPYPGTPVSDPTGASAGTHVLRGGAWNSAPDHVTCAYRYDLDADDYYSYYGFRCVAVPTSGRAR